MVTIYKLKKKSNLIASIMSFVVLLAAMWIMEATGVSYLKDSWITWYSERHFLIRMPILIVYFAILWVVVHYWYKMWKVITWQIYKRFNR